MKKKEKGKLYIIPSELASDAPYAQVFTQKHQVVIQDLKNYFVENAKTARRFIRNFSPKTPLLEIRFFDIGKRKLAEEYQEGLELLLNENMGLLSEAGCPSIADPGQSVVAFAHKKNIEVVPLVGPSSIILALMASGLNGQSFAFLGYLPIDKIQRQKKIKVIENNSRKFKQTQIFIETPYRNNAIIENILENCYAETQFCIASELTSAENEWIRTKKVKIWRRNPPNLHKKPAIFLLQA